MRICKIASTTKFANFLSQISVFRIEKILENMNFPILKIRKFSNSENSPKFLFSKVPKIPQNLTVWKTIKIPRISNLVNDHLFEVFE